MPAMPFLDWECVSDETSCGLAWRSRSCSGRLGDKTYDIFFIIEIQCDGLFTVRSRGSITDGIPFGRRFDTFKEAQKMCQDFQDFVVRTLELWNGAST
jgi:hypothetical protein